MVAQARQRAVEQAGEDECSGVQFSGTSTISPSAPNRPSRRNSTSCSKRFRPRLCHEEQATGSVRSGSYVAGVSRLRPLSESECYARLYGDRESTVAVIRKVRARASERRPSRRAAAQALRGAVGRRGRPAGGRSGVASAVPDVLAPGLAVVFCGINPGRVSAAAAAHFANPRNDFWRLLHDAGFTPRLVAPAEQFEVLRYGIGADQRRRADDEGLGRPAQGRLRSARPSGSSGSPVELRPRAIAFVGKEAYRGAFGERPEHGRQERSLVDTRALRPSVDLARERGRAVRGAASLVPRAAGVGRRGAPPAPRGAGASSSTSATAFSCCAGSAGSGRRSGSRPAAASRRARPAGKRCSVSCARRLG